MKPQIKSISTSKLVIAQVIFFHSQILLSRNIKSFWFNVLDQSIMVKSWIFYTKHLQEYCFFTSKMLELWGETSIISTWWKSGWQARCTWWCAIIQQDNVFCHHFYSILIRCYIYLLLCNTTEYILALYNTRPIQLWSFWEWLD